MSVPGDNICQVSSDSMSIVKCQVSGIRCQVITCQVPVSDIKCQGLGVKYNMSSPVSDIKCHGSCVKYNISVSDN